MVAVSERLDSDTPTATRRILRHYLPRLLLVPGIVLFFFARLYYYPGWFSAISAAALTAGILSNLLVISLNEGFMPIAAWDYGNVLPPSMRQQYRPIDSKTRLPHLDDWIPLGRTRLSPGDLLLVLAGIAHFLGP
jgi:hypothetical protein